MQAQSGNPAVRQGLIFGVILAVVSAISGIASLYTNIGFLGILTFIIGLVLLGLAGYRASAVTGKIPTGLLAGLIAGALGSFLGSLIQLPFIFLNISKLVNQANATIQQTAPTSTFRYDNSSYLTFAFVGIVVGIVIYSLVGLAAGSIGGAIGKGKAQVPAQQYQESMYQGLQQPGGYPPPQAAYPQPQQPPQQYPPQQYPPQQQ